MMTFFSDLTAPQIFTYVRIAVDSLLLVSMAMAMFYAMRLFYKGMLLTKLRQKLQVLMEQQLEHKQEVIDAQTKALQAKQRLIDVQNELLSTCVCGAATRTDTQLEHK